MVLLLGCADTSDKAQDPVDSTDDTDASTDSPPNSPPRVRWMLHGGGSEDDAVFQALVDAAGGGRMVTLGALDDPEDPDLNWWDGYFLGLGAAEAATVNTSSAADADDPALAAVIAGADGLFLRGGDQSRYMQWRGQAVGDAIEAAFAAGAVIGGSSAGCAVLGEQVYDAREGSVDAWELLRDARDPSATLTPGFSFGVEGVLTDTHFTERGRLPRLATLAATWAIDAGLEEVTGVGVDPNTALFLRDDGTGFVMGEGAVTLLRVESATAAIVAGEPPSLSASPLWQLPAGYEVDLRAADPIVARPAWVVAVTPEVSADPFMDRPLSGDAPLVGEAGSWSLVGADDAWAYVDRALSLEPGVGDAPGLLVQPELYIDSDLFEARLAGLTWAMATKPGLSVVGIDVGLRARTEAPRRVEAGEAGALLILDGRAVHHAGDPGVGWQTSALEGASLTLLGAGEVIDL